MDLKSRLLKSSAANNRLTLLTNLSTEVYSVDSDQTAPMHSEESNQHGFQPKPIRFFTLHPMLCSFCHTGIIGSAVAQW